MESATNKFEPTQRDNSTDLLINNSNQQFLGEKTLDHNKAETNVIPEPMENATFDQEKVAFDPDSEEIRRVRWKVDKRLIPLLSILYLCSFLDRSNIGNAKVASLEESLGLRPGVYNTALSIFFLGYVIGEIPANIALKKLGPRIWIPIVMIAWGSISICMAAVKDGTGLIVARFFLGLAESGYAPAPVFIISLWYRRCEHALRVSIFFSAATVAGAFGGLLAYAISQLHGDGGLEAWQWIFILEGVPTILCAIMAYFLLPDFPATSKFLTEEEKELTIKRLKIDAGPATSTEFSWQQFYAVYKDWKVYFHMCIAFLHSCALMSLSLFVPSITLGFGFDRVTTQIMTTPIYAVACICTILLGFSSDRFQERGYHGAAALGISALGYILLIVTREASTAAKYISLILCTSGVYAFTPVMLSWPSSNIGGHTKRGVAIATIISFGQIGGAVAGGLYREDDAPHYVRGNAICAGLTTAATFLVLIFKACLRRENKRRDQLSPEEREKEIMESDNTDSNPDYRFFE
ncbi:hypothetical protein BGZ76_005957 [Entomortierella beljakovae]|nr:hypothetical protein BGZ76_005957 [Entomortierella beljakovae]